MYYFVRIHTHGTRKTSCETAEIIISLQQDMTSYYFNLNNCLAWTVAYLKLFLYWTLLVRLRNFCIWWNCTAKDMTTYLLHRPAALYSRRAFNEIVMHVLISTDLQVVCSVQKVNRLITWTRQADIYASCNKTNKCGFATRSIISFWYADSSVMKTISVIICTTNYNVLFLKAIHKSLSQNRWNIFVIEVIFLYSN